MARLIWSPKSLSQLDEIAEYSAIDSPTQAKRVVQRILTKTERLVTSPESGAVTPEFPNGDVREIHVFRFRVLYRFMRDDNVVRIVGVVHGARLLHDDLIEQPPTN